MGSLLPLAAAGLARRVRARATPVLAGALPLGLGAAATMSGGAVDAGAGPAVEAALLVLGILCVALAVGSGGALPADRASGVDAWLAASAASPLGLRVAPAVAGAALSLGAAALGALLALGALAVAGRMPDAEIVTPVPVAGPVRLVGNAAESTTLTLPGTAGRPVTLIVDGRTVYRTREATARTSIPVWIGTGADATVHALPLRGSTRLAFPGGSTVRLRAADPDLAYVLREVAVVRGARAPFLNLLFAGLLLGLGLAVGAPLATLLSRFTSGPTAALSAATLLGLGLVHGPLLGLAADAEGAPGGRAAAAVLRAAATVAPDLSGLAVLGDAARGRAIPIGSALLGLGPALGHAALVTALLLLGRARRGRP